MILYDPETREDWLKCRCNGIGGSDAGTVLGVNPYKTNVELYEEKAGIRKNEFQGNAATQYGKDAEQHIRGIFLLDHPEYSCEYHEYRMYADENYPYLYATLDGELTETATGRKGILEIKTGTVHSSAKWSEWDGRIPDVYYAQILHQLFATGWDFVDLRAYLKYDTAGEVRATVRDYHIERSEVETDITALVLHEIKFWDAVKSRKEPALIMPGI